MKRIGFLAICLVLFVGCAGKDPVIQEIQDPIFTQTPVPTNPQFTPTPSDTPTPTTIEPTPTEIPIEISQVDKGSDDWYSVEYLYPQNGYDQIIKITFLDQATSIYLGFKDGSWVVITEEYG